LGKVPIPGAPDIAIEVISPSERAFESQQKVAAYLRFGTRKVWQIYPKSKSAVIHYGATSETLKAGEQITTKRLPGFSLEVHSLFRS
jgi:Uma2 family endonuclease